MYNCEKCYLETRDLFGVNLITTKRPSEMVRLKVSDFDLENRTVQVMMVKQGDTKEKRLTLESVQAIQSYIAAYELISDDYFVNNFIQKQISVEIVGTSQLVLSLNKFKALRIKFPCKEEQLKISHMISFFETKINLEELKLGQFNLKKRDLWSKCLSNLSEPLY